MRMDKYVIIVAGGSGQRMGTEVPKQFLCIKNRPILMHTIEAFYNYDTLIHIIVVLPSFYHEYWTQLCEKFNFKIFHSVVNGGENRFSSVKNGLTMVKNSNSLIAVHDAVRPLISQKVLHKAFIKASEKGNAVVAIPSKDSVRIQAPNQVSKSINRSWIYLIQTPQIFYYQQLKDAYLQAFSEDFTDDASVVEKLGYPIFLVDGEQRNFKITFLEDLKIAEDLME